MSSRLCLTDLRSCISVNSNWSWSFQLLSMLAQELGFKNQWWLQMESSEPHKNLRFWPEPERKPHKNQAKTTPEPDKNPVFKTHAFKGQKLGFQKLGFQLLKTRFLETATVSSSLTQLCMMAPRHRPETYEGRMPLCSFCGRIMRVKVCAGTNSLSALVGNI